MLFPNPKMLLHIGMADAYAAAAEYLKFPRDSTLRNEILRFKRYHEHPTHRGKLGAYTDDTEMSVANALVLIENDVEVCGPLTFANAYVREFARGGKRPGYSNSFQAFLERVTTGEEFLRQIRPDSSKNGAAMRAMPFGVLPSIASVLHHATQQARLTHDTPEGVFSSRAVALMSHGLLHHDVPVADVGAWCEKHLPKEDVARFGHVFRERWSGKPVQTTPRHSVAITTVHAVVDLITYCTSLMEILETAIRWGGDTDSVAAIAWGIAGCRYQDEKLPEFLERDLEGGSPETGAPYLLDLGTQLMKKFS